MGGGGRFCSNTLYSVYMHVIVKSILVNEKVFKLDGIFSFKYLLLLLYFP